MPKSNWQSRGGLGVLKQRAELLRQIRSFFYASAVLEVDTPILGRCGVTDLHIDCVEATTCGRSAYLQSSPEYFMKRLLAQGSGPIYYLGKVFRDEERGRRHLTEFTMLEWYRPDWDEFQLMDEVDGLIKSLARAPLDSVRVSYGALFQTAVGLDPHRASLETLASRASDCCGGDWRGESRSTLLDLLFSMVVEPSLPSGLVFVHDYPACQSALARLGSDRLGNTIARRFELFYDRMELGNGYFELTDVVEQQSRFVADNALRAAVGKKLMEADQNLLAALEHGLPECSGVAIGVDRLLMQVLGKEGISDVVPFG